MLPSPSWVSYEPQSQLAGNKTIWLDTREADDWRLTAHGLRNACAALPEGVTGILLLNSPNNPVGSVYGERQLKALASIARQYKLLVISDEIYGEVHHQGQHRSMASFYPEGTVVTTGLSKWCGAGGWRLGVAAFPRSLEGIAATVASLGSETYTSVSAPIQYAAIEAFGSSPEIEDYLARSRKVLEVVQTYARSRLCSMGLVMPKGEGGFYLFCHFKHYCEKLAKRRVESSNSLAETLLLETGVATLPGSAFGRPQSELTLRLSYVDFDGSKALEFADSLEQPEVFERVCPKIVGALDNLEVWLQGL